MDSCYSPLRLAVFAGLLSSAPSLFAAPVFLDQLYDPRYGGYVKHEGYLEFINPNEPEVAGFVGTPLPSTPPGVIQTEEYTGYTLPGGQDLIEVGDSDTTAGDRADFDWVQENRSCETGGPCNNPLPVNHPGLVGAMGWTIASPDFSPHIDPGTGAAHGHSDEEAPPGPLPHHENEAYDFQWINAVDVFSIISLGQDDGLDLQDPASMQAAALDYVLDFGNSITGAFSPGVLSLVWIPGWTGATYIDDYVARWLPAIAGNYNIVAIEPSGFGDQRTEIDALKGLYIPEPGSLALLGLGLGLFGRTRRSRA